MKSIIFVASFNIHSSLELWLVQFCSTVLLPTFSCSSDWSSHEHHILACHGDNKCMYTDCIIINNIVKMNNERMRALTDNEQSKTNYPRKELRRELSCGRMRNLHRRCHLVTDWFLFRKLVTSVIFLFSKLGWKRSRSSFHIDSNKLQINAIIAFIWFHFYMRIPGSCKFTYSPVGTYTRIVF